MAPSSPAFSHAAEHIHQLQSSPHRLSPLSQAFVYSSSCDTPSTPAAMHTAAKPPPTPPDSSSRPAVHPASPSPSSPRPSTSSTLSISSALSVAAPQFQSRLIDAPIDIHRLHPALDSPLTSDTGTLASSILSPSPGIEHIHASAIDVSAAQEHDSPTPTQDSVAPRKLSPTQSAALAHSVAHLGSGPAQQVQTQDVDDSRTPNVYINGLPPNFPEDQLFAMTREFGTVTSVRTFTRHVSDKPSGYGFVLFETIDAAEKCIETLRKYRNLHPSFSKQIHKIPGTIYSTAPSATPSPALGSSEASQADSFKLRMEQLKDQSSTNLYMEGLPLSIDERTLTALVAPYNIMSSRFFQTRLSSPPRIIAFVRLESRAAAEEIVERLHGRLVRGWKDTGCRISVRFADTTEQRELRRMERHNREGEQSPARLTMAEAALLNLKGTQYQAGAHSPLTSPNFGLFPNGANTDLIPDDFVLGQMGNINVPLAHAAALSYQQQQQQQAYQSPLANEQNLSALMDSLGYNAFNAQGAQFAGQALRTPLLQDDVSSLHDAQTQMQLALSNMSLQGFRTRAQNGFTAAERLILQAHARQQQVPLMAPRQDGQGRSQPQSQVRGVRSSMSVPSGMGKMSSGPDVREVNRRLLDSLPQMSEDDFHASAGINRQQLHRPLSKILSRADGDHSLSHALELDALSNAHQRNHTHVAHPRAEVDASALHTRATTLPSLSFSNRTSSQAQSLMTISAYDINSKQSSITNSTSSNTKNIPGSKHEQYSTTNTRNISSNMNTHTQSLFVSKSNINIPSSAAARREHEASEEDDGSVSPALTYSTRTPASLSPATPYSGFFPNPGDAFEGPGLVGIHPGKGEACMDVGERAKMRAESQ